MTKLVHNRHQIGINAGFENFRDYQFQALGRFDYSAKDCLDFHEAVAKEMNKVDPYFGECLSVMNEMGHLDLDSKQGKRPGGYNMPLPLSGVPFIFMNSANTVKDVCTMLHERKICGNDNCIFLKCHFIISNMEWLN